MGRLDYDTAGDERELEKALAILREHDLGRLDMCTCGRAWPCVVADVATAYAESVQRRIEALTAPTQLLPVLEDLSSAHLSQPRWSRQR